MILRLRWMPGSILFMGLAMAFLAGAHHPASASPLDSDSCARLRAERESLLGLGLEENIAKGAEWAKTHLTPADLNLVKRYLEVYEQLKFRCESVVAFLEEDEPDEEEEAAGGLGPPLPERNLARLKRAAAPANPPELKSDLKPVSASQTKSAPAIPPKAIPVRETKTAKETGPAKETTGSVNAGTVRVEPARAAPAQ